jgi:hypothetical protein
LQVQAETWRKKRRFRFHQPGCFIIFDTSRFFGSTKTWNQQEGQTHQRNRTSNWDTSTGGSWECMTDVKWYQMTKWIQIWVSVRVCKSSSQVPMDQITSKNGGKSWVNHGNSW